MTRVDLLFPYFGRDRRRAPARDTETVLPGDCTKMKVHPNPAIGMQDGLPHGKRRDADNLRRKALLYLRPRPPIYTFVNGLLAARYLERRIRP